VEPLPGEPLISVELAAFIESGISVLVGSRDARLRPDCLRAAGAYAGAALSELTIFLPAATSARTLANLRDNGRIAVTVTRAVDHRSLQLKGPVLEIRESTEAERELIVRYLEALALDWGFVGVPRKATLALNYWPSYTVRLAVESLFEQTPGPEAGARISSDTARGPESAGASGAADGGGGGAA
jgi:hypothetical protein